MVYIVLYMNRWHESIVNSNMLEAALDVNTLNNIPVVDSASPDPYLLIFCTIPLIVRSLSVEKHAYSS